MKLVYPKGAALPSARLNLPGGGDMSLFSPITVQLESGGPGGTVIATTTSVVAGTDQITVNWSNSDLAALPAGTYGLTVIGVKSGKNQQWTGRLTVTPS